MVKAFLDTSFVIALSSATDRNHERAVELAKQIRVNKTRLVTTQAILLKVGDALSKQKYRAAAVQILESLETNPSVEVVLLILKAQVKPNCNSVSRVSAKWQKEARQRFRSCAGVIALGAQ